jgi:hypothetical protein
MEKGGRCALRYVNVALVCRPTVPRLLGFERQFLIERGRCRICAAEGIEMEIERTVEPVHHGVLRHMKTDLIIEMIGVGLDNQEISRKGEVLFGRPAGEGFVAGDDHPGGHGCAINTFRLCRPS